MPCAGFWRIEGCGLTKRDWAHLIGWAVLVYLLWGGRAFQILALDSSKRVARLEAQIAEQEREIERLRDRADDLEKGPDRGEWKTYKWYVDQLRAIAIQEGTVERDDD